MEQSLAQALDFSQQAMASLNQLAKDDSKYIESSSYKK